MTLCLLLLGNLVAGLLAGSPVAAQQGPVGVWSGHWERDGSTLAVEMTFSAAASGYEGSFSSPQLRVVGIPLTSVKYEAPAVLWEIVGDETTMAFEGTVRGDTLAGRFREGTASGSFSLTRATSTEAPVREDEVTFANGSVMLSGTMCLLPERDRFLGSSSSTGRELRVAGPPGTWRMSLPGVALQR